MQDRETALKVGDVVPITFTSWKNPPMCRGVVESVDGGIVHFTYTHDSEAFAGLRGMLRLPGWTKA